MKQTILVTGGAGYIGSHTVLELVHNDYHVVVIDKSCSFTINHPHITYFQCDIADTHAVKTIFTCYKINAVVHCAASIEVGASVVNPAAYYENNLIKTILFLDLLREHGINNLVFSSSAAVYGIPHTTTIPLKETDACAPISPYGKTKYMIEQVLLDYDRAYGLKSIALRYFNAVGAWPEYNLGERHEPETHLIPRMLDAVAHGAPFTLFGNDYDTPDGTCIRDYLHVRDIARAHRQALEYLRKQQTSCCVNLGTGRGFSVQEIIKSVERVTDKKVLIKHMPRRAGDPASLVADTSLAHTMLSWQPRYHELDALIMSAYEFYIRNHTDNGTLVTTNVAQNRIPVCMQK